jgi:hypothetical protein
MSLPTGSWTVTADGLDPGTLTITSVDASGNLAGVLAIPNSEAVVGFFDATAQTVTLSNVANPANEFYVFSAALFQVTDGSSKTQTTTLSVLAGTYESYPPGIAATTGRWVASLSQKVKEKDKEEKEKEQAKDTKDVKDRKDTKEKEAALEKPHPDLFPQFPTGADPTAVLQQLTLRLDAIEQRLASGQAFIRAEERPEVGSQVLQSGGA